MRITYVRNLTNSIVGACGKSIEPQQTIGVSLTEIQDQRNEAWSSQLAGLSAAGLISVSLEGQILTTDQIMKLDAPLSADLVRQDWQNAVLDRHLTDPPLSPLVGDRYLIAAGATGGWAGWDGYITTWNGMGWIFTTPTTGMTVYVVDEALPFTYNGASWATSPAPPAGVYTTTSRPDPLLTPVGTMIFNTDDGAPNWCNGTQWVDASGTPT